MGTATPNAEKACLFRKRSLVLRKVRFFKTPFPLSRQRKGGRGDFDFPPDLPNRPKGGRSRPLETHLRERIKCCLSHALTWLAPTGGELADATSSRQTERGFDTAQFHQYPTENDFQNPISFVPPKDVQGVLEKSCGLFNPERGKSLLLPKA